MTTATTERKFYVERNVSGLGGVECVLGFTKIGDQDPYFHALAGEWGGMDRCYSTCANHALLAEKFPKHAHLVKWHLVSLRKGPMHYEANARYWLAQAWDAGYPGPASDKAVSAFKSTVVFGAVETDGVLIPPMEGLGAWLRDRKPALMAKFKEEIDAAFPAMWTAAEAL